MRVLLVSAVLVLGGLSLPAQQMAPAEQAPPAQQATFDTRETRDPAQTQDEDFAKVGQGVDDPAVLHRARWSITCRRCQGIPTPKDVLGYHVGAPAKLTYYADILKYYRALAAATPRVKIETIGKSDEDRELVVVWVSSDENIKNLQQNRDNLAKIADPRGLTPDADQDSCIATTKPHYHLMGGLHSGETGPSEMLMELVYRLATETSPLIKQIRDNVIVSVTPVADADGRDRNVDWFYRNQELTAGAPPQAQRRARGAAGDGQRLQATGRSGRRRRRWRGGLPLPYWGKYVYHDNNRDINLSQMLDARDRRLVLHRASADHARPARIAAAALHLQRRARRRIPNLDPILFAELPLFSNFELAQMTKWGMPGVYTHAFMDGWSPGYLGSVAYNHNGMMRMYETQGGNDVRPARRLPAWTRCGAAASRGGRSGGGRGGDGRRGRGRTRRAARGGGRGGGRSGPPTGTRRRRSRASGIAASRFRRARSTTSAPQQHQLHGDRRPLGPAAHVDVPQPRPRELLPQDAELDRGRARPSAPYGYVIPGAARHDASRRAGQHPARCSGSRSARRRARSRSATARSRPAPT